MDEPLPVAPFSYPEATHTRRHGPMGYTDSQRFKPWLRDEFQFRCVYCLMRERWCPDGADVFSVEHYRPRALAPEGINDYDNLLYTCCRCNAAKRDLTDLLNPSETPLAKHLAIHNDGSIRELTEDGKDLIRVCQLDRPALTEFRLGILEILRALESLDEAIQRVILRRFFGFPPNLPRLSTLRPPGGNSRPQGIADCFWEQRQRNELVDFY